jgi:RNA polymerase subunit RPABC4/transcription elongation factor Spt4
MILDPTFLSGLTLILTGLAGAFLVALWLALVIWTYRDMRSRHRDRLVQILAALMVALLNLPGVLVYLILRPAHTLEEEYQQTLEEEALLQSIEDQSVCPGCERQIREDWLVCPSCHTKLRKHCHSCGRLMELPWNICPYCGTPAPGMRKEGTTMDEVVRNLPEEKLKPLADEPTLSLPDEAENLMLEEDAKAQPVKPIPVPSEEGEKPQPEISDEPFPKQEEQAKK